MSFSYPGTGRKVLKGVSLGVRPGQTVAIVGENGAGKTTLAKLMCRLYDPQEGSISWDGADLRTLDLEAWREKVAMVDQDYARFPATARENVGFGLIGEMHDEGRVLRAAERAGMGPAIGHLPRGLDTPLSKQLESGIEPSGGQWQRIAIARALIRSPKSELLILDEPTAALDAKTEHEVLAVFHEMARGKATVVISHRLALARAADRVVVMEDGRIVEGGTHEELMDTRGRYHEMFYAPGEQLGPTGGGKEGLKRAAPPAAPLVLHPQLDARSPIGPEDRTYPRQ